MVKFMRQQGDNLRKGGCIYIDAPKQDQSEHINKLKFILFSPDYSLASFFLTGSQISLS